MKIRKSPNMKALFLLLFLFPVSFAEATELILFTEELPPLYYMDPERGEAAGYSVEVVKTLCHRAGIDDIGRGHPCLSMGEGL